MWLERKADSLSYSLSLPQNPEPSSPQQDQNKSQYLDLEFMLHFKTPYTAERKELLPFTTAWMELEGIMLSEISQAVKEKYQMISPIGGT